jgi:hypothetical protein
MAVPAGFAIRNERLALAMLIRNGQRRTSIESDRFWNEFCFCVVMGEFRSQRECGEAAIQH